MAKFKQRKKIRRTSPYSAEHIRQQREEMYKLLGSAQTDAEKDAIATAYDVTIRPSRPSKLH